MSFLTSRERQTLVAICETLVPRLAAQNQQDAALYSYSAADSNLAQQLEAAFEEVADREGQARLRRVLALLESRLVNGAIAGRFQSLSRGDIDQRAAILKAWECSRFASARSAFEAFKRLALFLHYCDPPAGQPHPAWPEWGYGGQTTSSPAPVPPLRMLELGGQTTLDADVLIIGSGAGGGVVAAELAAAGKDVLVVEKSGYYTGAEFGPSERLGMSRLYENHGSLSTSDLSMVVLAGSTLGGGTTVNWMTSLRPPDYVLEEWAKDYGFEGAMSPELQASLDTVSRRLHVTLDESAANPQNAALERGCRELGYRVGVIPRNVQGCRECDYCCFGCRFDAKQDTRQTYLHDAQAHGARILTRAHAQRITHEAGRVTGAVLLAQDASGVARQVAVRARQVVVAAGSIHTPALLVRSGLVNPNLGRHLHLHPTTATVAHFESPMHSWRGVPQSRYCDEFANLDGKGYGVRLETAPAHPGLWALSLPWQSPGEHRRRMQQLPNLANIIVLTRDRNAGRVEVDRSGNPRLVYRLDAYDAGHMMRGAIAALRIHWAAGATEVGSPHYPSLLFRRSDQASFEAYLAEVARRPLAPNRFGLFSAHQLSSCRLAASAKLGVVNPSVETFEIEDLYVADGSILPTACGVNPMLTIMGLAHYLARQMA